MHQLSHADGDRHGPGHPGALCDLPRKREPHRARERRHRAAFRSRNESAVCTTCHAFTARGHAPRRSHALKQARRRVRLDDGSGGKARVRRRILRARGVQTLPRHGARQHAGHRRPRHAALPLVPRAARGRAAIGAVLELPYGTSRPRTRPRARRSWRRARPATRTSTRRRRTRSGRASPATPKSSRSSPQQRCSPAVTPNAPAAIARTTSEKKRRHPVPDVPRASQRDRRGHHRRPQRLHELPLPARREVRARRLPHLPQRRPLRPPGSKAPPAPAATTRTRAMSRQRPSTSKPAAHATASPTPITARTAAPAAPTATSPHQNSASSSATSRPVRAATASAFTRPPVNKGHQVCT